MGKPRKLEDEIDFQAALAAAQKLFGNTSRSPESTKDLLETLVEEIEVMIESLEANGVHYKS